MAVVQSESSGSGRKVALALAAHPDDIEFLMAGTLLLLKDLGGYEIHYMTLADGCCGSAVWSATKTRSVRLKESKKAATILGATYHRSLCPDLEVLYSLPLLRRLASTMRKVAPTVVLLPSPSDYMEDHVNTCRLGVTAAFTIGMPNFVTQPKRPSVSGHSCALYHASPHGLRDGLGVVVRPEFFVDTEATHERKREALLAHQSQWSWLELTQGENGYLGALEAMSLEMGQWSKKFRHAEGWRRHSLLGYGHSGFDPLKECLADRIKENPKYRKKA